MIFGKHTLDETRDLLAVADYRFKETGKAYDALQTKPDDITADWLKLSAKWKVDREDIAHALLMKALSSGATPASIVATEPEWIRVLGYVQGQELVKGSLQDVTNRIGALRGAPILYPNQPSQNSSDVDSSLFSNLDSATKKMDSAAEAAKEEARKAATSNTGLIIGGSILGTIVAVGLVKHYL